MNKSEKILANLNEEQKEALLYFKGPLRIIAGAGSGKTRVLTRKVAYLINDLGIAPSQILAVTFTNKAANEMSTRVRQYTENLTDNITISTFHSLCAKILRKEANLLGLKNDFQILDEADRKTIFNQIYKKHGFSTSEINYTNLMHIISLAKNKELTQDELLRELNEKDSQAAETNRWIVQIYNEYKKYLAIKKCLDFDDLILKTKELFDKNPDAVKRWAMTYSFILVDEFQDTSNVQYEIVKYLSSYGAQLTIVGDPDQTIYTWRGADVNLILNFDKDFKNVKTVILKTNYRSTPTILNAANKLIKYNKKRFSKDLITMREDGEDIQFTHAFSVEAEARWVVQKINELKKKKIQLKNIAIFYRANYYSRPFEEELIKENINHKIFNGQKFFQRKEVKDALAFLRVIYDSSDVSLARVINIPPRKIGEKTYEKIMNLAQEKKLSLYNTLIKHYKELDASVEVRNSIVSFLNSVHKYRKALKSNSISQVLDKFLNEIKYYQYIDEQANLRGTGVENVKELINSIKHWEHNNPSLSVKEYLESVSLLSAGDEYDNFTNYITLMTVHSAKGLEFDNVFLVGMSDLIFPSNKSLENDRNEALEEERRLAYVAITRARDRLFISDSRGYYLNSNIEKTPSRFITEMGLNLDDFILKSDTITIDYSEIKDENELKEINKMIIAGDVISHTLFGEGKVLEVHNDTIDVLFINQKAPRTLAKNHPSIRLLKDEV